MIKVSVKKQIMQGFTLVELLIVVIILAILAAIVVPQFASTTDDAKDSALDSTLASIRSGIALYKQQHNEYPGRLVSSGGGADCTGTTGAAIGTGAVNTEVAFLDQLAYYSNAAGATCTARGATNSFPFGPYIQKRETPKNAITNSAAVVIVTAGLLEMTGTGAGLGWQYDTVSGKFIANDTNADNRSPASTYDKH